MPVKELIIENIGQSGLNTDIAPWAMPPEYITGGNNFRVFANRIQSTGSSELWTTPPVDFNAGFLMYVIALTANYWLTAGRDAVYVYDGATHSDISSAEGYASLPADGELDWTGCMLGSIPIINNPSIYLEYWSPQGTGHLVFESQPVGAVAGHPKLGPQGGGVLGHRSKRQTQLVDQPAQAQAPVVLLVLVVKDAGFELGAPGTDAIEGFAPGGLEGADHQPIQDLLAQVPQGAVDQGAFVETVADPVVSRNIFVHQGIDGSGDLLLLFGPRRAHLVAAPHGGVQQTGRIAFGRRPVGGLDPAAQGAVGQQRGDPGDGHQVAPGRELHPQFTSHLSPILHEQNGRDGRFDFQVGGAAVDGDGVRISHDDFLPSAPVCSEW